MKAGFHSGVGRVDVKRDLTGRYVRPLLQPEPFEAFVPAPLPPEPPLQFDDDLLGLRDRAHLALGRLDSISTLLPDPSFILYLYVRKEAVLSSQIEGTQSSLSDLLLYETDQAPGVPLDDVREVSRYVAALDHGLARLREGFPLSLRLLCEIHGVLLSGGRGSEKMPGELRTSQNWIGGTRPGNALFVPPPPYEVLPCLGALERFLHGDPTPTPTLVKAALAHVQFETIHPFLDGNGRLGRLLITLLLCAEGALAEPLLYLSLYFKTHRDVYYELLQRVRLEGDWESWLRFFLEGVVETAEQATATAHRILALLREDREQIDASDRTTSTTRRLHDYLSRRPMTTIRSAADALAVSRPTVATALRFLHEHGIVAEVTGHKRDRVFVYRRYLGIVNEGTTPETSA
jgi:Fic family protein